MIVPVIMLVVALVQATRVVTLEQSTWQGAGFGMFATYDFDDTRSVVAVAVIDGRDVLLSLDGIGPSLRRRARVVPSDAVLRTVGEVLVSTAPAGTASVRVEVRGPRLDDGIVHYEIINEVTVDG